MKTLHSLRLNPLEKSEQQTGEPNFSHPPLNHLSQGSLMEKAGLTKSSSTSAFRVLEGCIGKAQVRKTIAIHIPPQGWYLRLRQLSQKLDAHLFGEYSAFSTVKNLRSYRDHRSPSSARKKKQKLTLRLHLFEKKTKQTKRPLLITLLNSGVKYLKFFCSHTNVQA